MSSSRRTSVRRTASRLISVWRYVLRCAFCASGRFTSSPAPYVPCSKRMMYGPILVCLARNAGRSDQADVRVEPVGRNIHLAHCVGYCVPLVLQVQPQRQGQFYGLLLPKLRLHDPAGDQLRQFVLVHVHVGVGPQTDQYLEGVERVVVTLHGAEVADLAREPRPAGSGPPGTPAGGLHSRGSPYSASTGGGFGRWTTRSERMRAAPEVGNSSRRRTTRRCGGGARTFGRRR